MPTTIKKSESWKMFDDISPRYDLLNRLLSFGLDIHWRNQLAKYVNSGESISVLDVATGTADVLLTFFRKCPNIDKAWGIDLSEKMMAVGQKKINQLGLQDKIQLKKGDACSIPFDNAQFDNVSISFGIRNVQDPLKALKEMCQVIRGDGTALILEFSMPKNLLIRVVHLFYLRWFVPVIGWIFSGHYRAYKYLNQTIEEFPSGEEFTSLMLKAGFKSTQAHPLLFGVATIYVGTK